jgi:hypothetical protein
MKHEVHTHTALRDTAAKVRRTDFTVSERSEADQNISAWREAFADLGIDVDDEATAIVAFATAQVLLFHFIDAAQTRPMDTLREFGERLTGAVFVFSNFVSES